MRNFAGNGANGGGEVPDMTAAERIDKIGNISALAIMETSETVRLSRIPPSRLVEHQAG